MASVEPWELFSLIFIIFLLAFPFREHFIKNFRTVIGALAGLFIGRIFYIWTSSFLGYHSTLIKIFLMVIGASILSQVSKDLFDNIFPRENKNVGRRKNPRRE